MDNLNDLIEINRLKDNLNSIIGSYPQAKRLIEDIDIYTQCHTLISNGVGKMQAYELVAEDNHTTSYTVRRICTAVSECVDFKH